MQQGLPVSLFRPGCMQQAASFQTQLAKATAATNSHPLTLSRPLGLASPPSCLRYHMPWSGRRGARHRASCHKPPEVPSPPKKIAVIVGSTHPPGCPLRGPRCLAQNPGLLQEAAQRSAPLCTHRASPFPRSYHLFPPPPTHTDTLLLTSRHNWRPDPHRHARTHAITKGPSVIHHGHGRHVPHVLHHVLPHLQQHKRGGRGSACVYASVRACTRTNACVHVRVRGGGICVVATVVVVWGGGGHAHASPTRTIQQAHAAYMPPWAPGMAAPAVPYLALLLRRLAVPQRPLRRHLHAVHRPCCSRRRSCCGARQRPAACLGVAQLPQHLGRHLRRYSSGTAAVQRG